MTEIAHSWPQTREEFAEFVEALQNGLVRYAFARLGSLADAEDAVQDVLVRAWLARPAHAPAAFAPYVYRMLVNRCIDIQRSGRVRLAAPFADRPDAGRTPEELAAAAAERARIEALLARLPEREAEVLRLRVFGDLSFAEIAAVTRAPLATTKSRFRCGLEKLRRAMKGRP